MIDLEKYRLNKIRHSITDLVSVEIELDSRKDFNCFTFTDEELEKLKQILKEYDKIELLEKLWKCVFLYAKLNR